MKNLVESLEYNTQICIKGAMYQVKTKTWYTIEEDETASYIKCELTNNKILVVIPDDNLIYLGEIINSLNYTRISSEEIEFNGRKFDKTGDGHQIIKNIEFGNDEEVEGRCTFEDYESNNNIISLGILPDKNSAKADVYADIIELNDIKII